MAIYHYWIAKFGTTHGPDGETLIKLKKTYESMFPVWAMTQADNPKPGNYDGASLMPDGRIVVIVGNNGAGTGHTCPTTYDNKGRRQWLITTMTKITQIVLSTTQKPIVIQR